MEVEDTSASKSEVDKPPSTPDMSAHDAEAMIDSMFLDSPLPNLERGNEDISEDDGSGKLPEEEDDGEKLPEGGNDKLLEEIPTGKLVPHCIENYLFSALNLIK